ncbi:MAG TPA: ABC transporter ATP-binding protein [Patescibacteria group bacterium]|nr:ABC transporter ATP-binding protein [Patescibacteria group bacterium]
MGHLIEVNDLRVSFGATPAVDGISFQIRENEVLVLAGESGSGKTVTALALTRILPASARIVSGSVTFRGQDLLALKEEGLAQTRGRDIAYIFQEPASFLNPVFTIGSQIMEAIILHQARTKQDARKEALALLGLVQIKEPERVFASYPHQLSGGMNQRVFTAMSLACRPKLLIADEPTTALDVTVESQIVKLLMDLKKTLGFSMLFITHNLALAKKIADRVCVMYRGKIVEEAGMPALFARPQHFHTKELIAAYEKIGKL